MAVQQGYSASKIGIVSRDLKVRDFSAHLKDILLFLDGKQCDVVLFSLYSMDLRNGNPVNMLPKLSHVKMIVMEICDYIGTKRRDIKHCSVFIYRDSHWHEHKIEQAFGSVNWGVKEPRSDDKIGLNGVESFVKNEIPERIFLNDICILVCGEINAAKYSKESSDIDDIMGLSKALAKEDAKIILNPGHDRMTRFEMPLKRQYLSRRKRWVISVWNKGGEGKSIGKFPAWQIWHNGKEVSVDNLAEEQQFKDIEIGVVDLEK